MAEIEYTSKDVILVLNNEYVITKISWTKIEIINLIIYLVSLGCK